MMTNVMIVLIMVVMSVIVVLGTATMIYALIRDIKEWWWK